MAKRNELQAALETLALQARSSLEYIDSPNFYKSELEDYNKAYQLLKDALEPKVKIVYEYKLKRSDGMLLDRSNWSTKGKTYKNKAALMSALGQHISAEIDKDPKQPKFRYLVRFDNMTKEEIDQYHEDYNQHRLKSIAWREHTEKRNVRASHIPNDWIVIAIAVNTAQAPIETNARIWYNSVKKPEDA